MSWAVKERFDPPLDESEWLPGSLYCKSLSFGSHTACLHCFFKMCQWHLKTQTIRPWVIEAFFVSSPSAALCHYPSTSFLHGEAFTPHSLSIPPFLPLPLLLSLFAKCFVAPRFPTDPGSERACPSPAPSLLWEGLTPQLFSPEILWHTPTLSHTPILFIMPAWYPSNEDCERDTFVFLS